MESMTSNSSLTFEAPKPPAGFTPLTGNLLQEAQATMSGINEKGPVTDTDKVANKYQEPTETPDIDKLMANILAQGNATKNQEEVVQQVQEKLPQEVGKQQGFFARIFEAIKNYFKDLFR